MYRIIQYIDFKQKFKKIVFFYNKQIKEILDAKYIIISKDFVKINCFTQNYICDQSDFERNNVNSNWIYWRL